MIVSHSIYCQHNQDSSSTEFNLEDSTLRDLKILNQSYFEPNYAETIYPNDSLTYNQYVGEFIAGYTIANGWRKDSINGGLNKEVYRNPYLSYGHLNFEKQGYDKRFSFFRYKNGLKYSGPINDTLILSYTPSEIAGYLYGRPYYVSKEVQVLFTANCINGLLQGKGKLIILDSLKTVAKCNFENGEIVGECYSWYSDLTIKLKVKYVKGKGEWTEYIQYDKNGTITYNHKRE